MSRYNFGEKLYKIHEDSITLGDQATLFEAYLLSELGKIELDPGVKEIVYYIFDTRGRGNVTNNACDYDNGAKLKKDRKSDRSVRWITRPESFERGDNGWKAKLGADSDVHEITIPETGYVERTCDGAYRPGVGTPFSTVETRKAAKKSWTDKGFSLEFAENVVSSFYSRNEGEGTASVLRWCGSDDDGRFSVSADDDPDYGSSRVGSFPASRSAERSEASHGKGIVVMDEAEYKSVMDALDQATKQLKS